MKKLLNTLYVQSQGSYLRQEGETVLADFRAVASEEKRAVLSRFFKSGTVSTVNIITRLARQNSATAISKSSFYMSDDCADLLCGKISGIIIAL